MLKYNSLWIGWNIIFSSLIFTEIYLLIKDSQCGNISMTCIHYWLLPAEFYLVTAVIGIGLYILRMKEINDGSGKQATG